MQFMRCRYRTFLSLLFVFLLLFVASCSDDGEERGAGRETCGDGVCEPVEANRDLCPEDCDGMPADDGSSSSSFTYDPDTYEYPAVVYETGWDTSIDSTFVSSTTTDVEGDSIVRDDYFVVNPSTGAALDVSLFYPDDEGEYPGVILIPGGNGDKTHFMNEYHDGTGMQSYTHAERYAQEGFAVLAFSIDGRGESEGEEDYNGYAAQDGLYELYRFLEQQDNVDADNMGIVSYSYGVVMATGMLARYQVPARYYIEWEGPVNRWYVTVGCGDKAGARARDITCDSEDYWQEREAMRFVSDLAVDHFVIVQKDEDHVQPTVQHSVDMNNRAVAYLDWVRVNGEENDINQEYSVDTLPVVEGKGYNEDILSYMVSFTSS